jgi:hypothetical protein
VDRQGASPGELARVVNGALDAPAEPGGLCEKDFHKGEKLAQRQTRVQTAGFNLEEEVNSNQREYATCAFLWTHLGH